METLINKICEMANVMHKSVTVDEDASVQDKERLTQLEIENKGLRELLEICSTGTYKILDSDEEGKVKGVEEKAEVFAVGNEKQETEEDEKSGEKTPRNEEPST